MNPCWVYPVPQIIPDEKSGDFTEFFVFDTLAYSQPRNINLELATVLSTGALRAQRYVEIMMSPVEFCPITSQLSVIDKIEVTLNFTNPQGEVRQNVGIFNKVAVNTFINYDDDGMSAAVNDKAFKKNGFVQGTVQWKKINNPSDVNNITADYLIICADTFYRSGGTPHSEVLRLAEHRAFYNGFDVMILNVEDIISDAVGFYYEGATYPSPPDKFKKEQRMRTCIRTLYEEGTANNTGDGKLGYVLLVGDNYTGNTGMPVSRDHDLYPPSFYDEEPYPTDYYFSCITRDAAGKYSEDGSLFIGRLSVQNEIHLFNMIEKIINFETEYNPQFERKKAGYTYGRRTTLGYEYSMSYLEHIEYFMSNSGWDYSFVNYYDLSYNNFRTFTLDYFNNGAAFVQYLGWGEVDKWGTIEYNVQDTITQSYFSSMLQNYDRTPFVNAISNWTGQFDNEDCLGEFLTRYSPNKGAVGYIGASNNIFLSFNTNSSFTNPLGMTYQERFLFYLFKQTLSISGELLLTTKMNATSYGAENFLITRPYKYAFNLFGDPALNIMAEPDFSECPVRIESTRVVQNGDTLIVPSGCELRFFQDSKLIIEKGGTFIAEDGAQINGIFCKTDTVIHVKGGEFTVGNNVIFNNINRIVLENDNSLSYDFSKHYQFENVTFNNTFLSHRGTWLTFSKCNFNQQSNINSIISSTILDSCNFNESALFVDQSLFSWSDLTTAIVTNCNFNGNKNSKVAIALNKTSMFNIDNNTIIGYAVGISLDNCGETISIFENVSISYNDVSLCGTGIELFNSVADFKSNDIHDNFFGIRLYNNSYTVFENKSQAHQFIRDNASYELYASLYSFPTIFRYNQIIDENNLGNSFNDPLLYWDIDFSSLIAFKDISNNYWGKNFDPVEDLFPNSNYIYKPIWEGKSVFTTLAPTLAEILYQTGLAYFADKDYINAEIIFKELIEIYPQSQFAIGALHELFALPAFTNYDYFTLLDYFTTFTPEDSNLFAVADFLSTRCYVKEKFWQPAVDWYEYRIENPASYQDSVFAVIDLGYIHLMMEADTTGTNGAKSSVVYYNIAEIKPKSKQEYEINKASLLATLPQIKKPQIENHQMNYKDKKGSLGKCIPNPATGNAIITYEMYNEGMAEIRIYSVLGQLLQRLSQGYMQPGYYQTRLNISNLSTGIYHYSLFVNGEKTDAKKMIVN